MMSDSQVNFVLKLIADTEEEMYNICLDKSCQHVLTINCTNNYHQRNQINNREYVKEYITKDIFGLLFSVNHLKVFVIETIKHEDFVLADMFLDTINSLAIANDHFLSSLILEKYKYELRKESRERSNSFRETL